MRVSGAAMLAAIRDERLRLFTLADVVALTGVEVSAAAHALSRLDSHGLVVRLARGVYASRLGHDVHPFEAVAPIAAPWTAYVSLHSALSAYGILAQVPTAVWAVTAGRPRRVRTPLSEFRFHHLKRDLMWGFRWEETPVARYPIAEPEKALLDCLYLEARAGRGVALFPDLDLRGTVDRKRLATYINRAADERLLALARKRRLVA